MHLNSAIEPSISPRGPLSEGILRTFTEDPALHRPGAGEALQRLAESTLARTDDSLRDGDVQLALFLLYSLQYDSLHRFSQVNEWNPDLIAARNLIEARFERDLRRAIPRLTGAPKAALVEIQSDEYGGGRPDRVHAEIYANAMRAAGLDSTYGTYIDLVPAITLTSFNMATLFGLHRRFLGAIVGHLAAFEMTSSLPCRNIADGLRRLEFSEDVIDYYDEHVEADAVHEQIAARDLAGEFAEQRPHLLADIMFGAAACLTIDGEAADAILNAWESGATSLIRPLGSRHITAEAIPIEAQHPIDVASS